MYVFTAYRLKKKIPNVCPRQNPKHNPTESLPLNGVPLIIPVGFQS